MRDIHEGDKVTVYWNTNGEKFTGIVENVPANVGDLWYIRDEKGHLQAISSVSSNFEQICKLPPAPKPAVEHKED